MSAADDSADRVSNDGIPEPQDQNPGAEDRCRRVAEHLAELIEPDPAGSLGADEREELLAEIRNCPRCRELHRAFAATVELLRTLPPQPLPETFASDVRAAVRRESVGATSRWRGGFGGRALVAAAVVVIAAGGAWIALWRARQPAPVVDIAGGAAADEPLGAAGTAGAATGVGAEREKSAGEALVVAKTAGVIHGAPEYADNGTLVAMRYELPVWGPDERRAAELLGSLAARFRPPAAPAGRRGPVELRADDDVDGADDDRAGAGAPAIDPRAAALDSDTGYEELTLVVSAEQLDEIQSELNRYLEARRVRSAEVPADSVSPDASAATAGVASRARRAAPTTVEKGVGADNESDDADDESDDADAESGDADAESGDADAESADAKAAVDPSTDGATPARPKDELRGSKAKKSRARSLGKDRGAARAADALDGGVGAVAADESVPPRRRARGPGTIGAGPRAALKPGAKRADSGAARGARALGRGPEFKESPADGTGPKAARDKGAAKSDSAAPVVVDPPAPADKRAARSDSAAPVVVDPSAPADKRAAVEARAEPLRRKAAASGPLVRVVIRLRRIPSR